MQRSGIVDINPAAEAAYVAEMLRLCRDRGWTVFAVPVGYQKAVYRIGHYAFKVRMEGEMLTKLFEVGSEDLPRFLAEVRGNESPARSPVLLFQRKKGAP